MKDKRLITFAYEDKRYKMKDKRLITFVYEDKRYKMKDKRLITFVYTFSESALYSLLSFIF